nr:alpha/beta hydrolase domain-containing protein [Candidatus Frankia alpina]
MSQVPERPDIAAPAVVRIRPDLTVPVLTFQTETDLPAGLLGYVDARQDDTNRFRLWEVAGTAHADAYTIGIGATDRRRRAGQRRRVQRAAQPAVRGRRLQLRQADQRR